MATLCKGMTFDDDVEGPWSTTQKPLTRVFWRLHRLWNEIEEPERTGRLAKFVTGHRFEFFTLLMIVLNGGFIIYETDRCSKLALQAQQDGAMMTSKDSRNTVNLAVDNAFMVYFTAEVLLRLYVHRIFFFLNKDMWWNIFDLTIIVFTVMDAVMFFVEDAAGQSDVTLLRILRLFRMTRSLRVFRALHFVSNLRQLMECMVASLSGVFWCMLLLVFISGIFATFLVQVTTNYWMDPDSLTGDDEERAQELGLNFGSVTAAMFALFQATSGGNDWGFYYELLSITGILGPLIFVIYILFFIIAAWNIVTSLFIEKALSLAQPDMDKQMLEKRRQDIADAKSLLSLIQQLDEDGSGTISMAEFKKFLDQPNFRGYFEQRNIDIKDAEMFFSMLQVASGVSELQADVVVNGLMRMRGIASNLDLQSLQFQMNLNHTAQERRLKKLQKEFSGVVDDIKSMSRSTASIARDARNDHEVRPPPLGRKSSAMQTVQKDIEHLTSPASSPRSHRSGTSVV